MPETPKAIVAGERGTSEGPPNAAKGFLARARRVLVVLGGLYVLLILLLATPFFQTHMIYLHAVRFPFFAQFHIPEKYGLAPGKAVNLQLHTSDNVSLGAWFIFSDPYYLSMPVAADNAYRLAHLPSAIKTRPTILFLHGNAATRAAPLRVNHYSGFTSRIGANVLAVDYRGFGDSSGSPSQDGLVRDAHAGWTWLIESGAEPKDILIVGHSLGTAVATRLAVELGCDGIRPRGLVLLAPFSSMRTLLDTYAILGIVPIGAPLAFVPGGSRFITWSLTHNFDSLMFMPDLNTSVLIVHAENDWEIPSSHSDALFNALLEPLLPPVPLPPSTPGEWSTDEWSAFTDQQLKRTAKREELVTRTVIPNFGNLEEFQRFPGDDESKVMVLKTVRGGHNRVGTTEGVQYFIRRVFHFL